VCDLPLNLTLGLAEALANTIPHRKRWDCMKVSIRLVQGVLHADGARLELIHFSRKDAKAQS
jgi:hypothetical protein